MNHKTLLPFFALICLGCAVAKKRFEAEKQAKLALSKIPHCIIPERLSYVMGLESIKEPGSKCGTCPPRIKVKVTSNGDTLIMIHPETVKTYEKVTCIKSSNREASCANITLSIYCPPNDNIVQLTEKRLQ